MVSCIEVETGSLVFAIISLFSSCMGSLVCVTLLVYMNILLAYLVSTHQRKLSDISKLEIGITNYGLYINIGLAIAFAFVLLSLFFSIILMKGLFSRKAHLVKAYFIYGAIGNTLSALSAVFILLFYNVHLGLLNLFGCFLYTIILIMIRSTYDKFSNTDSQFNHKKLAPENPTV